MRLRIHRIGWIAVALLGSAAALSGAAEPARKVAQVDLNHEYSMPSSAPAPRPAAARPAPAPAPPPEVTLQNPAVSMGDPEAAGPIMSGPEGHEMAAPMVSGPEDSLVDGPIISGPGDPAAGGPIISGPGDLPAGDPIISGPAGPVAGEGSTCTARGGCCNRLVGGICRGAHCVCLKTRNAVCNLHYQKMRCMKCGMIKTGACLHNACAKVECCTSKVINGLFDP